jgi:hypothetical protein
LYAVFDTESDSAKSHLGENTSAAIPPSASMSLEDEEIENAAIIVFDTSIAAAGTNIVRAPPRALDDRGSTPCCSSLMKQTSELVVGRDEGIFSYSIEDRGGAAGLEGPKQCVTAVGR